MDGPDKHFIYQEKKYINKYFIVSHTCRIKNEMSVSVSDLAEKWLGEAI